MGTLVKRCSWLTHLRQEDLSKIWFTHPGDSQHKRTWKKKFTAFTFLFSFSLVKSSALLLRHSFGYVRSLLLWASNLDWRPIAPRESSNFGTPELDWKSWKNNLVGFKIIRLWSTCWNTSFVGLFISQPEINLNMSISIYI